MIRQQTRTRRARRIALLLCLLAALGPAAAAARAEKAGPAPTRPAEVGATAPASQPASRPADATSDAPSGIAGAAVKLYLCFETVGVASVAAWVLVWVALLIWSVRTPGMPVYLIGCFLVALVVVYALTAPRVGKVLAVLAWGPIAAALAVVLIWACRRRRLPLAFAAFLLALAAFGLAMWNSDNVSQIEEDRSAELAAARRRQLVAQEALHQAELQKLPGRADADAAETPDGAAEAPDAAADRPEAPAKPTDAAPPEYEYRKRGKQERDPGQIDPEASPFDAIAAGDDQAGAPAGRKLPPADLLLAHQLDRVNRFAVWLTLTAALLVAGVEYLRRFNRTFESILPLPIACRAIDAIWPKTHTVLLQASGGGDTVRDYLDTVVRKRETFILLSPADPWPGRAALPRLPLLRRLWPLRKIACRPGDAACGSRFVFESAWYGRYGFVLLADSLDGPLRAMLDDIVEMLRMRRHTRATARRTVHLVWNLPDAAPAELLEEISFGCRESNLKFVAVTGDLAAWPADRFEETRAGG